MMSILVKVILVLHVAFFPFVLQILPHAWRVAKCGRTWIACNPLFPCVWESSSLLVFVTHLSFNLFLLSSSHGSNPSSHRHHRLPSRPCCCLIFHSFPFTSWTEHVLKHPLKLKFMKLSFQRAITRMKRVPNKRVVSILLRRCNLSKTISDCAALNVFAYLLVRVFNIDDSWCVGKEILRSFWILLFFHCTFLNTCSNVDGNSDFPLKPCRWLMTLIAISHEFMGTLRHACKKIKCTFYPWGYGRE
jgi:hypothetical protein